MSITDEYLPAFAHEFFTQFEPYKLTTSSSISKDVVDIVSKADIMTFKSPMAQEMRIYASTQFLKKMFKHSRDTDNFLTSLASLVGKDIFDDAENNKYGYFLKMIARMQAFRCIAEKKSISFVFLKSSLTGANLSLYKCDQGFFDSLVNENAITKDIINDCRGSSTFVAIVESTKKDELYGTLIRNIIESALDDDSYSSTNEGLFFALPSDDLEIILPVKNTLPLGKDDIIIHTATGDGNCFYHALAFQLRMMDASFFTDQNTLFKAYPSVHNIDTTTHARLLREVVFINALSHMNRSKAEIIDRFFYVRGVNTAAESTINAKLAAFNKTRKCSLQLIDIFSLYVKYFPPYDTHSMGVTLGQGIGKVPVELKLKYYTTDHKDKITFEVLSAMISVGESYEDIKKEIIDILDLVKQHIEDRIVEMGTDKKWVFTQDIGYISFVLGVNITLLTKEEKISHPRINTSCHYRILNEQQLLDLLPYVRPNGKYTCYLLFTGNNHFNSITFKDEKVNIKEPGCLHNRHTADAIKHFRRFKDYVPITINLKLHMYSYAYMRNVHAQEIFAFVFYSVLTQSTGASCLLTQVKYIHALVASINGAYLTSTDKKDVTGQLISKKTIADSLRADGVNVLDLPVILGFGRDDNDPEQTGARYMAMRKQTKTKGDKSDPFVMLTSLIKNTSLHVFNAMYTSACLVIFFMLSPPVDPPVKDELLYSQDIPYVTAIFKKLHKQFTGKVFEGEAKQVKDPVTAYTDMNHYLKFLQKAWTRSPILTGKNIDEVMNVVTHGMLTTPEYFKDTAFFEFYTVCLSSIFYDQIYVTGVTVTGKPALISTQMTLPPTAVEFKMPAKTDTASKTLTIDVNIDNAFDPQSGRKSSDLFTDILANDTVELVVWFTQINPSQVIDMEVYRDSSKPGHDSSRSVFEEYETQQLGMQHFRDGSKTTFGKIAMNRTARGKGSSVSITIPFSQFDLEKLASTKQTCYLHFAMMVSEKPESSDLAPRMVRRGHSFVDIGKLDVERPFVVRLWEGPIDPSLGMTRTPSGQYQFTNTFTYEKTFDVGVTIRDPMGLFRPSMGSDKPAQFTMTEPNRMFDDRDMAHMAQYMYAMNTRLTHTQLAMHSLLYVNMPMTRNVVPLFAVSFLPPLDVLPCVLESRAKLVLDHENITAGEFMQIALVAFLGSLLTPEDAVAWGFDSNHFAGHEVFRTFARDRFLWIFTQIVNPFNKMRYAFDKFNRVDNEQMGMPGEDVGDCEDFAEAAMRFCKSLILNFDPQSFRLVNPVVYIVLTFLRMYTPCTSVLTTDGAAIKTVKQDTPAMGLHMLAILVLKTTIDPSLGANVHKLQRIVPLEGTGLQFNSYRTVDSCFGPESDSAVCRDIERIKESVNRYSGVVNLAYKNIKDVKNEVIVFPMMINRENSKYTAPGSGYTKWEFIYPSHYFYDNFVSLCHDQQGVASRFLDFGVIAPSTPRQKYGVPFYMAIMPDNDDKWKLAAIPLPDISVQSLYDICQRFADNAMPASALTLPTKHIVCEATAAQKAVDAETASRSYVDALLVKSVNFYLNTKARPNGRVLMGKLRSFFEEEIGKNNTVMKNTSIHGVDTIFTLNLNTNYLMIQVHLNQ